jgi:hypothetical protein
MEDKKKTDEKKEGERFVKAIVLVAFALLFVYLIPLISSAAGDPAGIDQIQSVSNTTKTAASAAMVNISGGYINVFNITARVQDPRWKGFVGNVTGSFTLDDSTGSTLYDWQLSSLTGRIFATRNDTSLNWASIECANLTTLNAEANALNLSNPDDTLNKTFNLTGTHNAFYVGSVPILANTCPTLNTYSNSAPQDTTFEEMALYSDPSIIYATIMEQGAVGYNGDRYDFQEIVPENGTPGFSGSTPYYLYIELGN